MVAIRRTAMRQNRRSAPAKSATTGTSERFVKDIRWATRNYHGAEEKLLIVLDGPRGEHSIAELCRREGIAESLYLRPLFSQPKT